MKLAILLLEDEAEVRAAVERDLLDFAAVLRIEVAEDVEDAWAVIDEINAEGDALAVAVCDHRLPGTTGIDFMGQMMTGQADLADTVRAVNEAGLDQYLGKPWKPEDLQEAVRNQLTDYVEMVGVDPLPYMSCLDQVRAASFARRGIAD